MNLGEKISDLRKREGISQEKLAELIGVSRQAVTKWENGNANPDTENLIRLSEIFNVSLDELCETETKTPKAKIQPISHLLVLFSLLTVAAYCVIGGISGNFSGSTLVLLIILALPMHALTHLVFWGMIKSGDFSMLAGYDSSVKYDTEGMKRYLAGIDFITGLTTVSYILIILATASAAPELKIIPALLFGYIISFVAAIFFMGFGFGEKIYLDPAEAKRAKRGLPASAVMMGILLFSVAEFAVLFELKGYENNTAEPLPMLGMMFVSIGFSLGGYLAESARLKKREDLKPFFGKAFIVCNILAIVAMIAMTIL